MEEVVGLMYSTRRLCGCGCRDGVVQLNTLRGAYKGVALAFNLVERKACELVAAESKVLLDGLVGAVETLNCKQVDENAVKVDVTAAKRPMVVRMRDM